MGEVPRATFAREPPAAAADGREGRRRGYAHEVSEPAAEFDEIVDLVDEDDHVVGTARKLDTDRDPSLVHREVAILVHRGGELLWQLRSAEKTVMPLTWDVACAGHVRAGEAPAAAAHRELREELGFDVELVAVGRRRVRQATESYLAHIFIGAAPAALEPSVDPGEVAAIEWCDEAGYRRWQAQGRSLSPVAGALAEAFWAARRAVATGR